MTDQERINRETLLKRAAAVAGAVYLAPVLTSAASAGSDGCLNFTCSKKKKKWKKKHRKKCQNSGAGCDCPAPGTLCAGGGGACECNHAGPTCGYVEACGTGNCACFHNGHNANPGHCIELLDGLCDTFLNNYGSCPGGSDAECGSGHVCFGSCCNTDFGYPPLCAPCCGDTAAGAATSLSRAGASVARF